MKKIILSVFAVIALSLLSQAQFRLGLKAGGNISTQRINSSEGNSIFSNDHYKTWHAGVIGDLRIGNNLYVQPQVLYTRKGSTLLSSTGASDAKVRINYIDVPVNVLYKMPLSFGKVFVGAGAAFAYGFGGKQEQNDQKTKPYSGTKAWKREDLSLSFTAGIELNNGLFASINSQKGLLDVYKADGVSIKNRSISASIGYFIDWKAFKKTHKS